MSNIAQNSVGIVQPQTVRLVEPENPLKLDCGKFLAPIDVTYETYGCLNENKDNVVLICHALSGDAHAAGYHSQDDKKPGWWENQIGPGKGIDTNKYFVICSNFLGGCSGTTGPSSINPKTGKPYGLDFPMVTIADTVKLQKMLLDHLGIKKLLAVTGGSIGGMQVLQWAIDYPEFVESVIPIATTTRLGAQAIAFNAVGRSAIFADPAFKNGQPTNTENSGLAIARMIGHITYLSEQRMHEKFGRELRDVKDYTYEFNSEFAVETYLDYQGQTFVERFDPYSYVYITKAMDYFDLEKTYGSLEEAFSKSNLRFLIISFTSDWLFAPAQSKAIRDALLAIEKDVSYSNIESPYGHDSFLIENQALSQMLSGFLSVVKQGSQMLPNRAVASKNYAKKIKDSRESLRARLDYQIIESLIEPNSKVLDIGCGNGELLQNLTTDKNINGRGIELEQELILECIKKRIPIIEHDIENGLAKCRDKSFDYVILSQTVQTIKNPEKVFNELLRIGKKVIVSFPNFAYWKCRAHLLLSGEAPVSENLPFSWHDSPNIHFLSLKDFDLFCKKLAVNVEKRIPLVKTKLSPVKIIPNLFAEQVIYVTSKS